MQIGQRFLFLLLFPYKALVRLRQCLGHIALHLHVEVVLFTEGNYLTHHGGFMVQVKGGLLRLRREALSGGCRS